MSARPRYQLVHVPHVEEDQPAYQLVHVAHYKRFGYGWCGAKGETADELEPAGRANCAACRGVLDKLHRDVAAYEEDEEW